MNILIPLLPLLLLALPAALYALILLWPRRQEPNPPTSQPLGGLSVILTSHNEEAHITRKVHELLAQCAATGLPHELIVVSDGSTDTTNTKLHALQHLPNLRLHILPTRAGKANAINQGAALARHSLLAFSDSRQTLSPDALRHLIANFHDAGIGAASATLQHQGGSRIRSLLNALKHRESRASSTIGLYGPLYIIRKNLFRPIPLDTILDDQLIGLQVIAQGQRVILDTQAQALDIDFQRLYAPHRALRLIGGQLQLIRAHAPLLARLSPRHLLFLFVQKYLKLLLPLHLCAAIALAIGLNTQSAAWPWLTGTMALMATPFLLQEPRMMLRITLACLARLPRIRHAATPKWERIAP